MKGTNAPGHIGKSIKPILEAAEKTEFRGEVRRLSSYSRLKSGKDAERMSSLFACQGGFRRKVIFFSTAWIEPNQLDPIANIKPGAWCLGNEERKQGHGPQMPKRTPHTYFPDQKIRKNAIFPLDSSHMRKK